MSYLKQAQVLDYPPPSTFISTLIIEAIPTD